MSVRALTDSESDLMPENEGDVYVEISSEEFTHFVLGANCTASLMQLSHESEPYVHGAVAFLMAKSMLRSLELNCCGVPPRSLTRWSEITCKLSKFVPWTMLNMELCRQSGLLDGWNAHTLGLVLAGAVPTALAVTELKESYFNNVAKVFNVLNLLGLGYLAAQRQNYWTIGMTALCAVDCFFLGMVSRCLRISESNTRNVARSVFVGMLPLYMKSL